MSSSRKGNPTKKGQAHQNTVAYHHNKNSKTTRRILSSPISPSLCSRCTQILEWRKSYRKYKPLTTMKKCVECEQKKIRDAYHIICMDCSLKQNTCPKCRDPIVVEEKEEGQQQQQQVVIDSSLLCQLRERERRSILRKIEKGQAVPSSEELRQRISQRINGGQLLEDDEDEAFSDYSDSEDAE